jgi:hypothetical protein
MPFWQFTGSVAEFFPSLGFTAQPGGVYLFGTGETPALSEQPRPTGADAGAPTLRWTQVAGPQTYHRLAQVDTVPASSASLGVSGTVDVTVYGAKGDNSTDDYAAIMSAIAACPAGGIVYFPPGTYLVTNTITIPANVTLRGHSGTRWPQYGGMPVFVKPKFGSFLGTALLSATETDGWRLENLTLTSGRATQQGTGGAVHGIAVTGAAKAVRMNNVLINNFSGHGVFTDSTANGWPGGWEIEGVNVDELRP